MTPEEKQEFKKEVLQEVGMLLDERECKAVDALKESIFELATAIEHRVDEMDKDIYRLTSAAALQFRWDYFLDSDGRPFPKDGNPDYEEWKKMDRCLWVARKRVQDSYRKLLKQSIESGELTEKRQEAAEIVLQALGPEK